MFCHLCGTSTFLPEPTEGDYQRGCNCPAMRNSITNYQRHGILNNRVLQLGNCTLRGVPVAVELNQTYEAILADTDRLLHALAQFRDGFWTSDVLLHVPQPPNRVVDLSCGDIKFRLSVQKDNSLICAIWQPGVMGSVSVASHLDDPGKLSLFSVNGTLTHLLSLLDHDF